MKNIIILLTFLWVITSYAVAPYGIKGQQQAATLYSNVHQFPNNQVTNLGGINALVETGNTNILSNPSFEHSTFSTSWTNSAGTFTQEASVVIDGKASAKLVLSAQTMSLSQSSTLYQAQFADGVQGLAMVRIKSDIALSVCSIQAGTVSTTNCVTTNTDSKWGLYKVPFILGATSNGVSIASSGSVTGTVYVDDAFVGAVDLKQDINNVGPWTSFTPTGTWIANTTYVGKYRQVGENYEYMVNISISGAPTATTLTVNLPSGHVIDTNKAPSTVSLNYGILTVKDASPSVYYNGFIGIQSTTAIYPSLSSTAGTLLTGATNITQASPITFASGDSIVLNWTVPIVSLSGSSSVYTASCGANCVDTFSAQVSSAGAGVPSAENVDFINGNCALSGTSGRVCTFNTGIFTVAPNCTVSSGGEYHTLVSSVTSSAVTVFTYNNLHAQALSNFNIICQKQGADFVATRTIQGSFNEVVTSPGISKPKVCHYAFGGAAATLAAPTLCTTGTCIEIFDSCGTGTPPTWTSTGLSSNLTFSSGTFTNNSFVDCKCSAYGTTTGNNRDCVMSFETGDNTISTNSSGGLTLNTVSATPTGSLSDVYNTVTCTGSAP